MNREELADERERAEKMKSEQWRPVAWCVCPPLTRISTVRLSAPSPSWEKWQKPLPSSNQGRSRHRSPYALAAEASVEPPQAGFSRGGRARHCFPGVPLITRNWKWNFAYIESDFRWKWEDYPDRRDLEATLRWVIFSPRLCTAPSPHSFWSPCKVLSVKKGGGGDMPW